MDSTRGRPINRAFRIRNWKTAGIAVSLHDVTFEEARALELIVEEDPRGVNGGA
jgi:hypothetical protein